MAAIRDASVSLTMVLVCLASLPVNTLSANPQPASTSAVTSHEPARESPSDAEPAFVEATLSDKDRSPRAEQVTDRRSAEPPRPRPPDARPAPAEQGARRVGSQRSDSSPNDSPLGSTTTAANRLSRSATTSPSMLVRPPRPRAIDVSVDAQASAAGLPLLQFEAPRQHDASGVTSENTYHQPGDLAIDEDYGDVSCFQQDCTRSACCDTTYP
jgi:hypothetical protein